MGDVYEDVVCDEDFSDVDEGDVQLSDDDIAHVLGLMDDGGGKASSANVVATNQCDQAAPTARVANSAAEGEHVSIEVVGNRTAMAVVDVRERGVSDFDLFLADFTRQQNARPHQENPMQLVCSSPTLNSNREEGQVTTMPPWDADILVTTTESAETRAANWGVFTPDKMPVRREFQSVRVASKATPSSHKAKLIVVPSAAFRRIKNIRVRHTSESAYKKEWTFRPTINKAYFRRRGLGRLRTPSTARFTTRMQRDITEREDRHRRRQADKRKQEENDAQRSQRRRSLVAKGSQAILERNGLWEESMDDRLERLYRRSDRKSLGGKTSSSSSTATKPRKRHQLREKEAAKSRACESLYRRGLEKLQKARDESLPASSKTPSRRASYRSDSIVRERLERDVELICARKQSSMDTDSEPSPDPSLKLPPSVSFVEFSCVLLYFGFVPDADTPWEGDPHMTLLWHAWITHAVGDREARCVPMAVLKQVLESVIVQHHHYHSPHRTANQDAKTRLLEIFRLNYIARKRSRGVSAEQPEHGALQHKSKGRSGRVIYSLHGKVAQPKQDAYDDLLEMRHSLAQQRVEAMRREKEQDELAECTFKPRISPVSGPATGYRFRKIDETSQSSGTEPEAFDRLYGDAFVRQNNNRMQYVRARHEEEERLKKEMRVSPTYVNGLTIEERLGRLHESLSNNALPAHFYEKIAEMRQAYVVKANDAREKASRLEPAHVFPRDRDGRTIVVPFTFATQQTTKEIRRRDKSLAGRECPGSKTAIASTLRDMRLHYAPAMEAATVRAAENTRQREHADISNTADLCIDVHVSPFETYELCLNRGDDVYEATRVFAHTYNLDIAQQEQLERHAQERLEQLFDL